MKKIILTLIISIFTSSIFASDEKPGRFFEDQPDVTDDYQIHFIYLLAKKTKDKERDINGWVEKEVKKIDDLLRKDSDFEDINNHFIYSGQCKNCN